MPDAIAYKDAEIALTVVKCGCGDPTSHPGAVCPTPRRRDDLGVVSRISKNPFKRLLWNIYGKRGADRRIQQANGS